MNRCLNERALLRAHVKEATAAEQLHLRLCADCAERYDALVDDLAAIEKVLGQTPPPAVASGGIPVFFRWAPVAAVAALLAVAVGVASLRRPAPLLVAERGATVSAFAADVSAAVFTGTGSGELLQVASETPDLGAALEPEWPCTQVRFLNGECTDQLSAMLFEME